MQVGTYQRNSDVGLKNLRCGSRTFSSVISKFVTCTYVTKNSAWSLWLGDIVKIGLRSSQHFEEFSFTILRYSCHVYGVKNVAWACSLRRHLFDNLQMHSTSEPLNEANISIEIPSWSVVKNLCWKSTSLFSTPKLVVFVAHPIWGVPLNSGEIRKWRILERIFSQLPRIASCQRIEIS